jgi:hypothetical protein
MADFVAVMSLHGLLLDRQSLALLWGQALKLFLFFSFFFLRQNLRWDRERGGRRAGELPLSFV